MPISFASLFRVFVMLVLAFHVFYMYCLARVRADTFGFDLGTTVIAALFGLAMLVPLVWAVTLPELPEIWTTHTRARRWWKRSRCPSCGYQIEGQMRSDRKCPECGSPLRIPEGYRVSARTVRMFITLNVLAWIIGCAAGEAWIQRDERAFARELEIWTPSCGGDFLVRTRCWPTREVWMPIEDVQQ